MKHPITINEIPFLAEAAAVSCIRYRSAYGVSPMADLSSVKSKAELKAKLARMVWIMASPEDMTFEDFAGHCISDDCFVEKALGLRAQLLRPDEAYKPVGGAEMVTPEQYDEFDTLARMAHTGVNQSLIYELPMPQLQAVVNRALEYMQKSRSSSPQRVMMDPKDVAALLPVGRR